MECKTHECIICNKQFSSRKALGGHIKSHYPLQKQPDSTNQTDSTSLAFHPQRSKRTLIPVKYTEISDDEEEEEVDRSKIGYTCRLCMQTFGSIQTLSVHEANHTDKMRHDMAVAYSLVYSCKVCDRIFQTKQGLGKHKKTHVPRVATSMNNGSIDHVPSSMEKPQLMIDLNEPPPADESNDVVPSSKD